MGDTCTDLAAIDTAITHANISVKRLRLIGAHPADVDAATEYRDRLLDRRDMIRDCASLLTLCDA